MVNASPHGHGKGEGAGGVSPPMLKLLKSIVCYSLHAGAGV